MPLEIAAAVAEKAAEAAVAAEAAAEAGAVAAEATEATAGVAETAGAVSEGAEISKVSEIGTKSLLNEVKTATEKKEIIESYANSYFSPNCPKIREKIEIAANDPEARASFLKDITEGRIKGTFNELERAADFERNGAKIKTQIDIGHNRVDLFGKVGSNPMQLTELTEGANGKLVSEEIFIKPGEKFAVECKEGSLQYITQDIKHISEQVNAGKKLSGQHSFLQITPENVKDLKMASSELQNKFINTIHDAGGRVIVAGTPKKLRIPAAKKAMKMAPKIVNGR